jgi:hypothetical protein
VVGVEISCLTLVEECVLVLIEKEKEKEGKVLEKIK